jgi:hypothetical protein
MIYPGSFSRAAALLSRSDSVCRVVREVEQRSPSAEDVAQLLSALGFTPWHGPLGRRRGTPR